MLADLGNKACEKVRLTTAANLADHFEGLEEAIPALKKAINDPLEEVRELAQQAFYRLASSVGIEQLPYYESELRRDPNDLAMLRIVLVLYLIFYLQSDNVNISRQQQILRIIATIPGSELAAPPLASLSPYLDGVVFDQAKILWINHVSECADDKFIISNAAKFFALHDPSLSVRWYRRCLSLDPDNPEWHWHLGNLYKRMGRHQSFESGTDWSAVCFSEFEQALELATENTRWSNLALPSVARAAFEAGEIHKAQFYAEELVSRGCQQFKFRTNKNNLMRGGFIHQGNLLLGRVALAKGDREEAKRHLILAITPPDCDPLILVSASGPSASLANDLLQIGERDCVIQYFQQCAQLWPTGRDVLVRWISDIQNKKTPNFGGNLIY
ncbi:tetratricopeptide repeat protein [Singulisphaera acidiphila]|nr:tetratricopeptide repeat protein [Singulisphaera acidiphila]